MNDTESGAGSRRSASNPLARAATITDVAHVAGVSTGTVSNVLNRPDTVSPHRRARVEEAIRELNFIPNEAARQLRTAARQPGE